MTTDPIIFIITTLLELIGFLLFNINLRAFYDTYTDPTFVKRIICVIGLIMIMLGFIINLCILLIIK